MTQPTESDTTRLRLTVVIVVVTCLFAALFARLWFLQVINAPKAQVTAENNGVRTIYTEAPRGNILDRNGQVLVGNVNEPVIEVQRQATPPNSAMVARLAALMGTSVKTVLSLINNTQYSVYTPVPVLRDASPQQILYVQEHQALFPGVTATTETVRSYSPLGVAAANIVGYVGQITGAQLTKLKSKGYQPGDQIGLAGVEATYESVLRGKPGVTRVQVDSRGNVLGTLSSTPPVQGHDLKLSIDGNVQQAAVTAVEQGLNVARTQFDTVTKRNFDAPAGSAVVEDPQDGTLLALATFPSYDPRQFIGGISQKNYQALTNPAANQPLIDRTIQGAYAPGSTFKLVTATAGLDAKIISANGIYDDTGKLVLGTGVGGTRHNDQYAVYGPINLAKAITVSSDVYFMQVGADFWNSRQAYGEDALQNVAKSYGFDQPTGVALPDEVGGKIPTPQSYAADYKAHPNLFATGSWYTGDSANVAIGQGEVEVTPLQLANAYSTFANGGTKYVPRLVLDSQDQNGKVIQTYTSVKNGSVPLSPADRAAMVQGFEGVVNNPHGTAYGIFSGPLATKDIAGKTGTAQVTGVGKQDTSVFTSFAPATNPTYEVTCIMEDSGYGASIAAPVVRQIYDQLYGLPLTPVSAAAATTGGAGAT
ncbi:penicillin-binding protein 2 [Acidiferrimicrobium sp. IK]|uniref:penicillin-binding protein 2 n=1 Tax=Acidiferrimicrobium sp. IK TaxID=2871700 RepID=UPI0021CB07C4|nr:penicillin-binding protein 2 [Acidiferrimicrobium sp. IK]MCU4185500.1 penicillin-binding protein 2 [Acidiferrimicrobium sp. IK]